MEAHVAAGNRAEALRVYERCRRLLSEELGAYPSPETESVYRSLLEAPSAPSEAPSAGEVTPAGQRARGSLGRPRAALLLLAALLAAAVVAATLALGDPADTLRPR